MIDAMRALTLVASITLLLAMSPPLRAQRLAPDLAPGVSEALATERAGRVSNLRYALSFDIPARQGDPIPARITITFALSDASRPLALDFEPNGLGAVRQVTASGATIDAVVRDGHLLVPASTLRPGTNAISIDFDAGDAPLNRNDDF